MPRKQTQLSLKNIGKYNFAIYDYCFFIYMILGGYKMGRNRSPNRDKSFEIYKLKNGNITSQEIADMLLERLGNVNNWRVQDKWSKRLGKVGAPYENKNAIGNKGGAAPKANVNSFKYGKYTARIPFAIKNIMQELDIEDPLEKLWRTICLHEARIIYMQDIMHVENKDDMTKEIKKTSSGDKMDSTEYEIQFAWDKEANLINTQSKAMNTLAKLLKQYDDMLHANWDLTTEEQRLRVSKLKVQLDNPEFEHRKQINNEKLKLEKDRFNHVKEMDEMKTF